MALTEHYFFNTTTCQVPSSDCLTVPSPTPDDGEMVNSFISCVAHEINDICYNVINPKPRYYRDKDIDIL